MPRYLKYDAVSKPSSDEFGVIVNINPNGTVDVDVAVPNDNLGNVIRLTNVPCTNGYVPKIGEWVHIGIYDGLQMVDRSVPNPIVDISTRNTVIVNPNQIASQVIDSAHIRYASIGSAHIQSAAIGSAHIQNAAITNAHIAGLSADKITTGYLSADRIRGGELTLGGPGNTYGRLKVLDGSSQAMVYIDQYGIQVMRGPSEVSFVASNDVVGVNGPFEVRSLRAPYGWNSISVDSYVYFRYGVDFNATAYFNYAPRATGQETGFCGCAGISNASFTVAAGAAVNFRVKKTYTPSSISLSTLSSTRSANTTQITSDGFWIYVNSNGVTDFCYWRGYYTA